MKRDSNSIEFNVEDRVSIRLYDNHIYLLSGDIDQTSIDGCIKWILSENLSSGKHTLTLYINSMGGDLYYAFALIDVMKMSKRSIRVVGIGAVMSAAFLIFAAGTKGMRSSTRNTSFMCHQYSDTFTGKHHDLKVTMKEGDRYNNQMIELLKEATGHPVSKIKTKLLSATDVYLTPEQAMELGVVDQLLP